MSFMKKSTDSSTIAFSNHVNDTQTILGEGAEFEGKLVFEGRVRIDGKLKGTIVSEGVLIIGATAEVEADIRAGTLIVDGVFQGKVKATDTVELRNACRFNGDIESSGLIVEQGVSYNGNCKTVRENQDMRLLEQSLGEALGPKSEDLSMLEAV